MQATGSSTGLGEDEAEVLVVGSSSACDLFVYQLTPGASSPVGRMLQSLSIVSHKGDELIGCLDINRIAHDTLAIAFRNATLILVMPLALGWSGSGLPLPFVQRFVIEEPVHQLSIMTGKSFQSYGQTLFMYRAHNFTREKDNLLGCNVVVNEVEDPKKIEREVAVPLPEAPHPADSIVEEETQPGKPGPEDLQRHAAASTSFTSATETVPAPAANAHETFSPATAASIAAGPPGLTLPQ